MSRFVRSIFTFVLLLMANSFNAKKDRIASNSLREFLENKGKFINEKNFKGVTPSRNKQIRKIGKRFMIVRVILNVGPLQRTASTRQKQKSEGSERPSMALTAQTNTLFSLGRQEIEKTTYRTKAHFSWLVHQCICKLREILIEIYVGRPKVNEVYMEFAPVAAAAAGSTLLSGS